MCHRHVVNRILVTLSCCAVCHVLTLRADVVQLWRIAREDEVIVNIAFLLVHVLYALLAVTINIFGEWQFIS